VPAARCLCSGSKPKTVHDKLPLMQPQPEDPAGHPVRNWRPPVFPRQPDQGRVESHLLRLLDALLFCCISDFLERESGSERLRTAVADGWMYARDSERTSGVERPP
jgi:hypothetical protein